MPNFNKPYPRRRRRKRKARPRKALSSYTTDYHIFRMAGVYDLETDSTTPNTGAIVGHANVYSLTDFFRGQVGGSGAGLPLQEASNIKALFDTYRIKKVTCSYVPNYNLGIIDNSGVLPGIWFVYDADNNGQSASGPDVAITKKGVKYRDLKRPFKLSWYPQKVLQGTATQATGWLNLQDESSNILGNVSFVSDPLLSTSGAPLTAGSIVGTVMWEVFIECKNRR